MTTLAQLGCGYWGPNLLRNFSAQPKCTVKWVAEQSPERRQYVENNFPKSRTTADWEEAVDDQEVTGVVIATPASTHFHLAKVALRAGKHVLVEKPVAMSTREAEELAALAASQCRILMVGHTFLYNAAVRRLKRFVQEDEVGQIYYIYSQRLNLGQVRSDVNVWWNLAPHDVSILLYVMDGTLPLSVSAHGVQYIQPGIEDVVFGTLTWENRVTAHIQVSWLDPGKVRKLTVVGSRKMIVYDDISDDKICVLDKGIDRVPMVGERMDYDHANANAYQLRHRAGDVWLPRIDFQEPLKTQAEHFLHCVRSGETPMSGPRHARDVVAVLEAGQRSLERRGQAVDVPKEGPAP